MRPTPTNETRTQRPSLLMRFTSWMISRKEPPFPRTAEGSRDYLSGRVMPRDAPMPAGFEKRYQIERWRAEEQDVVTLHPKSGPGAWHMIYFHGGGFVEAMFKEHWPLVAALVDRCGLSVTVPLYHVAPEAGYKPMERLADTVFAELSGKHDAPKIILCGDSAGGHMALSLALRLTAKGGPQPGKLALFSPWLDITMQDPASAMVEPDDIMLRIATLRVMGEAWAGDRNPKGPACSPLFAEDSELAKLPPTAIFVGTHDVFVADCRTFADRLAKSGVDTALYEYGGAPHVYMAVTFTRESHDTLRLLKEFLAK